MSLTPADVKKIASLACLAVSERDIAAYAEELSAILELVEQMNAIDTDGVIPMAHPLDVAQRLRADVVTETDQREILQKNAPQTESGLYLVPKVIE